VKVLAVIVLAPLVRVRLVDGSVIAYVYTPCPVTVKEAAVTVPAAAGSVTPPVTVRVPAGASITVPPVAVCTATLPKFMSTVFVMLIGVTIVAVDVADAVACAKELDADAISTTAVAINLVLFFIFLYLI
jgi:hypothetical protein